MLADKTFILGIGAQKAGTSWLYEYFNKRDEIYVSTIKEMHFFDQRHFPEMREPFSKRFAQLLAAAERKNSQGRYWAQHKTDLADRIKISFDKLEEYKDYFRTRVSSDCPAFCEITPAYSLLPANAFREIAENFPRHKIIFLMRDPIERYYAHVRMETRRWWPGASAREKYFSWIDATQFYKRGFYHHTIDHLLDSIDEKNCFFGFYEDFFREAEIRRLCAFLEIPFKPAPLEKKLNAGPDSPPLDNDMRDAAKDLYTPVYAYCREKFGSKVPSSWHF